MLSLQAAVLALSAVAGGPTVLLDFQAEWCGPCKAMAPAVAELKAAGVPVRVVDIDREPQLAQQFRVTGVPCFVMLVDGQEVDRETGATSPARLRQMAAKGAQAKGLAPGPASTPVQLVGGPSFRGQSPERASGTAPARPAGGARPYPLPPMQGGPRVSVHEAVQFDPRVRSVPAAAPARGEDPMNHVLASPSPRGAVAVDAPREMAPREMAPARPTAPSRMLAAAPRQLPPAAEPRALAAPAPARATEAGLANLMAASVRLKIADGQGHGWGSGTVIDSLDHEALIVTCGHVFRDSQGRGQITVDLFGPGAPQGLVGQVVAYDLERDVALVRVATPVKLPMVRVAPAGRNLAEGDGVVAIGCPSGAEPQPHVSRVTKLNKFLGPANVTVAGQPVQGRSGGGLFSRDGLLVGVCNAADPQDDEGIYAALASVHYMLDQAKLSALYAPQAPARELASPAIQPASHPAAVALAAENQPAPVARSFEPQNVPRGFGPLSRASREGRAPAAATLTGAPPRGALAQPVAMGMPIEATPASLAAMGDSQHAEVICIIRPLSNPQAKSEVVVLDRASPDFVRQLSSERAVQESRHVTSLRTPGSSR